VVVTAENTAVAQEATTADILVAMDQLGNHMGEQKQLRACRVQPVDIVRKPDYELKDNTPAQEETRWSSIRRAV